MLLFNIIYLRQRRRYMFCPHSFVCLSVGLWTRLLKNARMDWMKCCVSTDVGIWTNWLTFEPNPDYSRVSGCQNRIAFSDIVCATTRNFVTSWKSHVQVTAATRGFKILFTTSHGNNFVGGTYHIVLWAFFGTDILSFLTAVFKQLVEITVNLKLRFIHFICVQSTELQFCLITGQGVSRRQHQVTDAKAVEWI